MRLPGQAAGAAGMLPARGLSGSPHQGLYSSLPPCSDTWKCFTRISRGDS